MHTVKKRIFFLMQIQRGWNSKKFNANSKYKGGEFQNIDENVQNIPMLKNKMHT